jgi:predicted RNase H-like nuclease (RuvC/YqgF family)
MTSIMHSDENRNDELQQYIQEINELKLKLSQCNGEINNLSLKFQQLLQSREIQEQCNNNRM